MNKLTKVGISALAGSLAVVGANASEYSVTGDSQVVYSSAQGNEAGGVASNGKGIGVDTDIYFRANGELDNGWTVAFFSAMDMEQSNAATSGGLNSSAQVTVGMGSLGTIQFNDISGSAANGIDDVLPKAYEEVWDGTTHSSSFHSFGASTQSGSVDYRTPSIDLAGASMSATYTYDPNAGAGAPSAGGVSSTAQSGQAVTAKISMAGLTIGGGYEEITTGLQSGSDANVATGYALFSQGPLSIGYQEFYNNAEHAGGTQGRDNEGDGFGIAFAQDNYSISYSEVEETNKAVSATTTANSTVEMEALQATYTMGAATLGVSMYETNNPEGTTGKYEETEISVSFAF